MIQLLTLLLLVSSEHALANNEEHAVSTQTGANIYLVVTPGSGPSKREPGFYTRRASDWVPAVLGQIALHPQSGPIFDQFKISELDRRSQSAALVNGLVTLFSLDSSSETPGSVVQIGSLDHPVIHPLTHMPIHILPVSKASDVALFESVYVGRPSLLFGSVRLQGNKGITFVVKLGPVEMGQISLKSEIILLSQNFYDEAGLSRLAALSNPSNGESVWAPELDDYAKNSLKRVLGGRYETLMAPWLQLLQKPSQSFNQFVDLSTLRISSENLPAFGLTTGPIRLNSGTYQPFQVIDPIHHRSFISADTKGERPGVNGMVDLDERGLPLYRHNYTSSAGLLFELTSVEKVVKLSIVPRSPISVPVSLEPGTVEDFSIVYLGQRIEHEEAVHYLLYSRILSGRRSTTALRIKLDREAIKSVDELALSPLKESFFTQEDAERRFHETEGRAGPTRDPLFRLTDDVNAPFSERLNLIETASRPKLQIFGDIRKVDGPGYLQIVKTASDIRVVSEEDFSSAILTLPRDAAVVTVKHLPIDSAAQNLYVAYVLEADQMAHQIFFFQVQSVGDSVMSQAYRADFIEKMGLTQNEFAARLTVAGHGEDQRWLFDRSKLADRTSLLDIRATLLNKGIKEDDLGRRNIAERLEVSEIERRILELFPGIVVKAAASGQVAFSSADGTAIGTYTLEQLPARNFGSKEESPFKFYKVEGLGTDAELALMPVQQAGKSGPFSILGLISFVDEDKVRQYRAAKIDGSESLPRSGIGNVDLKSVRLLPVLPESKKLEVLLTFQSSAPKAPEPDSSDVSAKSYKAQMEKASQQGPDVRPREPVSEVVSWTFSFNEDYRVLSSGSHHQASLAVSANQDLYLASVGPDWYWVSQSAEAFLSKGLQLRGLTSGTVIEPNQSSGRMLRPKIQYMVPPEDRPTGASEGRFFFSGSWKAMPHEVGRAFVASGGSLSSASSPYAGRLFAETIRQIENYLQHRSNYRPTVLIVPDEIRPLLMRYLGEVYEKGDISSRWSLANKAVRFFLFPNKEASQYEIVDNLEVISAVDPSNNILFADLRALAASKNPTNRDKMSLFDNTKQIAVRADAVESGAAIQVKEQAPVHFPHLSFILASQGNTAVSYEDSRHLSKELRFPFLAVGTQAEWDAFINDSSNEFQNYGADTWFDILQVESPSVEAKVQLLSGVVDTPEIRSFRYRFDSAGISKKGAVLTDLEAQRAVLRHAVNRIETLSRSSEQNPFTLYLRFLGLFTESLVRDKEARRTQTIGKAFIERVLTQIFNIPLNRSFLAPDDPLFILSENNAAIKIQDAGYPGQMALVQQILEVLRSPLTPSQAKTIPSSLILAGGTGTGKSQFFQSLITALKLKPYSFEPLNPAENEDANALIIRADKLVMGGGSGKGAANTGASTMTLDDAISYIDHFLSLPAGYRGYIFIDDLHDAPAEVRKHLLIYLRGLFESPGGAYTTKMREFRTPGGRSVQIAEVSRPIRGLNLIAAMNFTENRELIEKFTKRGETPTLEQIILATLSTPDHPIETSFLKRWGGIIPTSSFPVEAKGPGVIDGFRKKMQTLLELSSRYAFVSTETIQDVAQRFKETDARTFLTDATNALYELADSEGVQGSVRVLAPMSTDSIDSFGGVETRTLQSQAGEIGKYVARNTQALDLSAGYEGKLQLLKIVASSFRLAILERFMQGLQEHHVFAASQADQRQNLFPMLFAIHDYIGEVRSLPLGILNLDSSKFGVRQKDQKIEFAQILGRIDKGRTDRSFFPVSFRDGSQTGTAYRELVTEGLQVAPSQTRRTVLNQYSNLIRPLLEQELAVQMRVESLVQVPSNLEHWFDSLRRAEPDDEKSLGRQLADIYVEFRKALYSDDLAEVSTPGSDVQLSSYHSARLFLYVIDHAISKIAWAEAIQFMAKVTEAAADEMVLSQSPGFHFLLNESKRSFYRMRTPDYLLSMVANFPAFVPEFSALRERQKTRFLGDCDALLRR